MKKTFLICGGAGFIGSHFIRSMLKDKNIIINFDLLTYAASQSTLSEFNINKNYKFVKGNIGDKKKIGFVLKKYKPDVIINFAAETHVDRSIDNPNTFINTNILGVYNLLNNSFTFNDALSLIDSQASSLFSNFSLPA